MHKDSYFFNDSLFAVCINDKKLSPAFQGEQNAVLRKVFLFDSFSLFTKKKNGYIRSGASTPRRAKPFLSTLRALSASLSLAAKTAGSSPLIRQAV